jgi:hypothetical protein
MFKKLTLKLKEFIIFTGGIICVQETTAQEINLAGTIMRSCTVDLPSTETKKKKGYGGGKLTCCTM